MKRNLSFFQKKALGQNGDLQLCVFQYAFAFLNVLDSAFFFEDLSPTRYDNTVITYFVCTHVSYASRIARASEVGSHWSRGPETSLLQSIFTIGKSVLVSS